MWTVLEVDEVNVDSFADKTGKCSVPGCEPQLQTVPTEVLCKCYASPHELWPGLTVW